MTTIMNDYLKESVKRAVAELELKELDELRLTLKDLYEKIGDCNQITLRKDRGG